VVRPAKQGDGLKSNSKVFAVCGLLLLAAETDAQIRITEIMAGPPGSEFRNEFVELMNTGDRTVDLFGWKLSDGTSADVLDFASSTLLEPGQVCLIVDPDYYEGTRPYADFPEATLIAIIADATIGTAGLNNVQAERVSLIASIGGHG
jgi:hypothetical protein